MKVLSELVTKCINSKKHFMRWLNDSNWSVVIFTIVKGQFLSVQVTFLECIHLSIMNVFQRKDLGLNAVSYMFAVEECLCQQIQTNSFSSLNHQDCCFQSRSFSLQNRYASPILPTICSDRQGHSRAKALILQANGSYCFPLSYDTSYRHWPWVVVSDQP